MVTTSEGLLGVFGAISFSSREPLTLKQQLVFTLWSIWKCRNASLFKVVIQEAHDVVAAVDFSCEEFKDNTIAKVKPPNARMVQCTTWESLHRSFLKQISTQLLTFLVKKEQLQMQL